MHNLTADEAFAHFGPVRWSETWLKLTKNTVPAELLWEKNTIPAEKKKPNKPFLRQANEAFVWKK